MPKPGSHVHIVKLESLNANSWYQTTLRSAQQMEKDIQAQTKLAVKFKLQPAWGDSRWSYYIEYVEENHHNSRRKKSFNPNFHT